MTLFLGSRLSSPPTREERLRELGYEEIPPGELGYDFFSYRQTLTAVLTPAQTPGERAFKLAAVELFLDGRYPSARAIQTRLGKVASPREKVKLNGRQAQWKSEVFHVLMIEPFWWRKRDRELFGAYLASDWLPRWRRGPRGTLQQIVYRSLLEERA